MPKHSLPSSPESRKRSKIDGEGDREAKPLGLERYEKELEKAMAVDYEGEGVRGDEVKEEGALGEVGESGTKGESESTADLVKRVFLDSHDFDSDNKATVVRNEKGEGCMKEVKDLMENDESKTEMDELQARLREDISGESLGEKATEAKMEINSKAPIAIDSDSASTSHPKEGADMQVKNTSATQSGASSTQPATSSGKGNVKNAPTESPQKDSSNEKESAQATDSTAETEEGDAEPDSSAEDRQDRLSCASRRTVLARLRDILQKSDLDRETLKKVLEMIDDLEDKAKPKPKLRKAHPMTSKEMLERFSVGYENEEERSRSWAMPNTAAKPENGMLLRAWDEISRARNNDKRVGFLSGGADWEWGLATRRGRRRAITRHGNWRNRKQTPFISTTSSWKEIVGDRVPHMEDRQKTKRIKPNTKITLFNANARLAANLPILRMAEEQKFYKVKTSGYSAKWYKDEFLLPFWAGPKEIVYTWTWAEIRHTVETKLGGQYQRFYDEVMVPKYKEHEAARLEGRRAECGRACNCCGH